MKINFKLLIFQILLLSSLTVNAQTQAEQNLTNLVLQITKTYPVPSVNNMLFYIQRNKNSNTVVYEANLLPDGKLNPKNPVNVYWMRYTEGGVKKELSWIQRWLAYGVDFEPAKDNSGNFIINLVALKQRKLVLTTDEDGHPTACLFLNGKYSKLSRIYAQAQETNWLPTVKFVQVMGEEIKTKQNVCEYIFPKQQ
jgi:hypothetical protein